MCVLFLIYFYQIITDCFRVVQKPSNHVEISSNEIVLMTLVFSSKIDYLREDDGCERMIGVKGKLLSRRGEAVPNYWRGAWHLYRSKACCGTWYMCEHSNMKVTPI